MTPRTIYLDHNATTPIDPEVVKAMQPFLTSEFGNPASIEHAHGHAADVAVQESRGRIAETIGADPKEIIFTGSCTESNNLAIIGVARASSKRHLITSSIEHPSVLRTIQALERGGWRVTYLQVDEYGRVSPDAVAAAICDDTALVSVMAANNEVGTIQPIREIGAICAFRDVLFHSDLAQILAYDEIDVQMDNIHLASLSAHKAYGPKGIGALYIRARKPRVRLEPIFYGGGQERGLRPGTLNTAAIVGFGEALSLVRRARRGDVEKLRRLCKMILDILIDRIDGVTVNGDPNHRIPNNLSLSIEGVEPLALIRNLRDQISFSASSACATEKMETSHVLLAMFGDVARARQAFRISPGRYTTEEDVLSAATLIAETAKVLKQAAA